MRYERRQNKYFKKAKELLSIFEGEAPKFVLYHGQNMLPIGFVFRLPKPSQWDSLAVLEELQMMFALVGKLATKNGLKLEDTFKVVVSVLEVAADHERDLRERERRKAGFLLTRRKQQGNRKGKK